MPGLQGEQTQPAQGVPPPESPDVPLETPRLRRSSAPHPESALADRLAW